MDTSASSSASETNGATAPAAVVPADAEFGTEYFETRPKTYSARIYRNLSQNDALRAAAVGRKLTVRDNLIIAATVLSSADDRIEELEQERKLFTRVRSFMNAPLFQSGAKSTTSGGDTSGSPSSDDAAAVAETRWFQRYLTLRNLLAVLVVVCGGIAGVMAYSTQNFKDRAEGAEKRLADLQKDADYWKNQRDNYRTQVDTLTTQLTDKGKELDGVRQDLLNVRGQVSVAQKTVTTRDATIQSLQQTLAKFQATAATSTASTKTSP